MAREGLRYQTFSRRAFLLAGAQGLALTALGGRLYYLSIVEGDKYKLRADRNRISVRWIAPVRGEIFDRHGRELATNRQDFRVFLIPEQARDITRTLERLGRVIRMDDRRIGRVRNLIKRQRKFMPVTIAQGLDWGTFATVNVNMPDLPGVVTDSGLSRYYPNGNDIAHLIGYMASPQEEELPMSPLYALPGFKVGRQGLERRYEDTLRGTAGTKRVEVNAVGREIRELPPRQEAVAGESLKLAIDLDLQHFTMKLLGEEAAGTVVLDIGTGEVLSLASTPGYDPNEFTNGISQENWSALLKDPRKPLMNKCVAGLYPPGSTFKPLVAMAALEQGVATPETEHYCNGSMQFGNRTFHCWQKRGHGRLNMYTGISNSCDVYFWKLAQKLDIDRLANMARRFGLGEVFDIGVDGEKEGLVPDREWKRRTQNDIWHPGETLNVSIGQGALLMTPLQLAVMTARLAGGRAVLPTMVHGVGGQDFRPEAFLPMDVNPLYMQVARRGMEMVTEAGGTAHDYRRPKSAPKQAGKTGTAQVRHISKAEHITGVVKNDKLPWAQRDHALFIGYSPTDNPEVAVAVLVQHGGGGAATAAPIGRAVMDKALELKRARAVADPWVTAPTAAPTEAPTPSPLNPVPVEETPLGETDG